MSRTWQTEEMAVNRIKIVEETQTSTTSPTIQIRTRGIPTRPDMRSESANEIRNMLVNVLSVFFLRIKKITRPLAAIIRKEMKDKSAISGQGRNKSSEADLVSLLDVFPEQLALHLMSEAIRNNDYNVETISWISIFF